MGEEEAAPVPETEQTGRRAGGGASRDSGRGGGQKARCREELGAGKNERSPLRPALSESSGTPPRAALGRPGEVGRSQIGVG